MDQTAFLLTGLLLGLALGVALGVLWARSRASYSAEVLDHAEVLQGLDRLNDQMAHLESQRASWQGQLTQQASDLRHTTDLLRLETTSLATALRRPQVRGRWGELHLRRTVELAGMVDHCDFTEQLHVAGREHDERSRRPDLVVHLAGGRQIVVDAKVPLEAFLDATSVVGEGPAAEEERARHLVRHAGQLRGHVEALAAKRYWRALEQSPEFVVLFLPSEAGLSAALEAQPDLLEHAAARQVVLATPSTLIALLRTVAHGWTHEALTRQAREIHRLGLDLHERLATLSGHLDQVGRSLNAAVGHYNQAVGSLESRALVSARRFAELGVTDADLPSPRTVAAAARRGSTTEGDDPLTVAL